MRLTEVANRDRTIDGRDDLRQTDIGRLTGQRVSTTDSALGANQTGAFQGEQDLFEIGLGETRPLGDVAYGCGAVLRLVQREAEEGTTCIVSPSRYAHDLIVGLRSRDTADEMPVIGVLD